MPPGAATHPEARSYGALPVGPRRMSASSYPGRTLDRVRRVLERPGQVTTSGRLAEVKMASHGSPGPRGGGIDFGHEARNGGWHAGKPVWNSATHAPEAFGVRPVRGSSRAEGDAVTGRVGRFGGDVPRLPAGGNGLRPRVGGPRDQRRVARRREDLRARPRGRVERPWRWTEGHSHRGLQRRLQHGAARARGRVPPAGQSVRGVVQCIRWHQRTPDRDRQPGRRPVQRGAGGEPVLPERFHGGRRRYGAGSALGADPRTVWAWPDQRLHGLGGLGEGDRPGEPQQRQPRHRPRGLVRRARQEVPAGGQEGGHGKLRTTPP